MASKYLVVLLVLCIAGILTLGIKRLLLMRSGFNRQKKSVNWIVLGLLAILTAALLSCNGKTSQSTSETADNGTEREPVIVSQSENETTDIHREVDGKGNVTATVTTSVKGENNEIITDEKVISGTRAEVDAQIKALNSKE
jgi:ABC-type glycerol-3-phosphate transport system substrate-binding protein